MIVAGEASGDHHAARLVEALHSTHPEVRFFGIGGEQMRAAGVETLVDSRVMAVVGLFEVLAHFGTIYGALQLMRQRLRDERPDLLILVDYPDFNLRLAKTAKQLGIKVLYYISPQIWAWRQKRVYKIKKLVDMMAVVFPFEVPFYQHAEVPVRFVGHPLVDEVGCELSRTEALNNFGIDPDRPVVGLFPGSRRSEIKRLLPLLLESAELIIDQLPQVQFLLPRASTLTDEDLAPYLAMSDLPITVISGRPYQVMRGCDTIISASGTATLEIALMEVPLVVVYRIAPMSYRIMSRLIKVDHIALCNIVAGARVAPELIQDSATPEQITTQTMQLLTQPDKADQMRQQLAGIKAKLGASGASAKVAGLTRELLQIDGTITL